MGRHYIPLPAYLTALALLAAPARSGEAPSGAVPDVVIQAESKRPVAREKPPLDLPVKLDQPLEADVESDDGVRARIPADLSRTAAFAPGVSESPLAPAASTNWIAAPWRGEVVRAIFPRRELQAVGAKPQKDGQWELVIADSQGKAFRRYAGQGEPPERVDFDGKSDGGEWLAVGHAYTPVLTYRETGGRARTALGRPFALAGLSVDQPRAVWLSPRALFAPGTTPELTPEGRAILREAAVLLSRHHPGLAMELAVNLVRGDPGWVRAAGELCVKELAKTLLVRPDSIVVKASAGTPDLQERVELSAVTR